MEYTTLPDVMSRLADRMEPLDGRQPLTQPAPQPEMDVD